mmetsp:Transcript_38712/g.84215  ORF Transcript_38712/g.84215 Transcript_38712/m.84215 type:complete len:251 (+) Transcript_38712:202-954(+)
MSCSTRHRTQPGRAPRDGPASSTASASSASLPLPQQWPEACPSRTTRCARRAAPAGCRGARDVVHRCRQFTWFVVPPATHRAQLTGGAYMLLPATSAQPKGTLEGRKKVVLMRGLLAHSGFSWALFHTFFPTVWDDFVCSPNLRSLERTVGFLVSRASLLVLAPSSFSYTRSYRKGFWSKAGVLVALRASRRMVSPAVSRSRISRLWFCPTLLNLCSALSCCLYCSVRIVFANSSLLRKSPVPKPFFFSF